MAYYPPKARTWHLRGASSDISGYQRLVMLPQTVETEGTVTGASSGSSETLIKAFSSDVLGVVEIAAGTWRFALKAKVDSATDVTTIKIYAYSRNQAGTETALFNVSSAEINATTATSVIVTSAQAAFTVDELDRLVIKFYAVSNSGSNKTVTLYYQGTTNYSTVSIPDDIPVRTGDMDKQVYDADGDGLIDTSGAAALDDLTDVVITAVADGEVLTYDSGTSKWVNAAGGATTRTALTGARTYYVRTDGDDANTGLVNDTGGAFLTIQKAIDTVCSIDMSIYQATIQVADGTYTGANTLYPYVGTLPPIIQGNTTTPANCIISTTSADCFVGTNARFWYVKGFKLTTATSGTCLRSNGTTYIDAANIEFGAAATYHMHCTLQGIMNVSSLYAITGAAVFHILSVGGVHQQVSGVTNTASGTLAFSSGFVQATRMGRIYNAGNTWSGGTITGKRYTGTTLSLIQTDSGNANYFPGNSAGTVATGAVYT